MNELEAFLFLNSIPYLGPAKIRSLVNLYGSANEVATLPISTLAQLKGYERSLPYWEKSKEQGSWLIDLKLVEQHHVQVIPFTNLKFPQRLHSIANPPALLYVKGNFTPQDQHNIAVIGTRNATIYGNEMAEALAKRLASHGLTVTSGLARGIDTSAHRGALISGRTQAVIGSGLACIYPPENRQLAEEIALKGTVISEFSMLTPPDRQNFPQRNRIVSGMTMATLLIEAPIKSGAMITVEQAFAERRKIFAIPGRIDSDNFKGNHLLIKSGKAHLVESAEDILHHFEMLIPSKPINLSPRLQLDNEERTLLEQMPNEEMTIDALVLQTGTPIQHINRILMGLVLKKIVREFPGKIYKKTGLFS